MCLLPARNAAAHMPDWLAAARSFCDAVIALDDGSTDHTGDLLRADPLVAEVLTNRRRESYFGWDDGANRNRLLAAAENAGADWILFVDADERIDADDGVALRRFVAEGALPGCAYGFQVYRMFENETYDPNYEWVYRLFAFRPGQRVPNARLDFNPVPVGIPQGARVRTTLRIKHYGEVGDAGRRARLTKYQEADPQGSHRAFYEGWQEPSPLPYPTWSRRPVGLPVLGPAAGDDEGIIRPGGRVKVVCLLPARNCAADLPAWCDSVARFADAVVALDDGSTDDTAARLEEHALVHVLLRNEVRPDYRGWDDAANRTRLLEASAALEPDWIISLDADERIPADDGVALREFLDRDALPGFAYGFDVYRMVGDMEHYDDVSWAVRMFAPRPDDRLRPGRLHFVPVPESIPRHKWLATTVRIQHLAALDERRRLDRWQKYQEADPERQWEPDYEYTRRPPGAPRRWQPRLPGLPVIVRPDDPEAAMELDRAELEAGLPVLSLVVVDRGEDADVLELLDAVLDQDPGEPVEVIAVLATADGTSDAVRTRLPEVRIVPLPATTSEADAANAGLRAARGDYVLFLQPGDTLEPDGLEAVLAAHNGGAAIVTGTAVNRHRSAAGWAAYFLDHTASLPGAADGELPCAPARGSFDREALLKADGFTDDDEVGAIAAAAAELVRCGLRAARVGELALAAYPGPDSWTGLLAERFRFGRTVGRRLGTGDGLPRPTTSVPQWFAVEGRTRLAAVRDAASAELDTRDAYDRVQRLVAAGAAATWVGAGVEIAQRRVRRLRGR